MVSRNWYCELCVLFVFVSTQSFSASCLAQALEASGTAKGPSTKKLTKIIRPGQSRKRVLKRLGTPTEETIIPIGGTQFDYEYTFYGKRNLLFESIGGTVFEISLGKNSKFDVLGLSVGDSEHALQTTLDTKEPDDVQTISFLDDELAYPFVLYPKPDVKSEPAHTLAGKVPNRISAFWFDMIDWNAEKKMAHLKGESLAEGKDGWAPCERLPAFSLDNYINRRKDYHTVAPGGTAIRYRVRNGTITLITITNDGVRSRIPVGMLQFQTGTPTWELEHVPCQKEYE